MKRMTTWVQEKLAWTPDRCVIYCGIFDIKGQSPDNIIDSLSILVSELKKKNNNMKVYVSLLAPSIESGLITKCTKEINVQITKWANNNNIHYVETELVFKDSNNAIEKACYHDNGIHQGSLLNRTGVIRLLEAWCIGINDFSPYVNWDKVKKNTQLILSNYRVPSQASHPEHNTASHNPPASHTPPMRTEEGWQMVTQRRGRWHRNQRNPATLSTSLGSSAGRYYPPGNERSHNDGRDLTS